MLELCRFRVQGKYALAGRATRGVNGGSLSSAHMLPEAFRGAENRSQFFRPVPVLKSSRHREQHCIFLIFFADIFHIPHCKVGDARGT